eukprot:gene6921-9934_t
MDLFLRVAGGWCSTPLSLPLDTVSALVVASRRRPPRRPRTYRASAATGQYKRWEPHACEAADRNPCACECNPSPPEDDEDGVSCEKGAPAAAEESS